MGIQKGPIRIKSGSFGDMTFAETKDGFIVRQRTNMNGEVMRNDPRFVKVLLHAAEFGKAGKAGTLIRTAMKDVLRTTRKYRVSSKMQTELMKAVKADGTSAFGQRNVVDGNLKLIEGFNFGSEASIENLLYTEYETDIDRAAGTVKVTIAPFVPNLKLEVPEGATHFQLRAGTAVVDFLNGTSISKSAWTAMLPLDDDPTAAISLDTTIPVGTTQPVLVSLGIAFYEHINGVDYATGGGRFDAVKLVKVDVV